MPLLYFKKSLGESVKFKFVSYFDNGKILEASVYRPDQLNFSHYKVQSYRGTFRNGNFYISENIDQIVNHQVGINVMPKTNPRITTNYNILLDYKKSFSFISKAFNGSNGFDDFNGSDCLSGSDGSNDDDGSNGRHGNHGHDLEVFVDCYFDTILKDELLKVSVYDLQIERHKKYFINTQGGSNTIITRDGDEGHGGDDGYIYLNFSKKS